MDEHIDQENGLKAQIWTQKRDTISQLSKAEVWALAIEHGTDPRLHCREDLFDIVTHHTLRSSKGTYNEEPKTTQGGVLATVCDLTLHRVAKRFCNIQGDETRDELINNIHQAQSTRDHNPPNHIQKQNNPKPQ